MHNLYKKRESLCALVESFQESRSNPVCLIAVSKHQSVERIEEMIDAGQWDFAENRVQEAQEKIVALQYPRLRWHFIGHLQSNKLKRISELFHYVHSLDSLDKAHLLNTHCKSLNKMLKVFVQVNVRGEVGKSGVRVHELEFFLKSLHEYSYLDLHGLMTLAPLSEDEAVREVFRQLRLLRDTYKHLSPSLRYLSMGMSRDYRIALEEGATHIRLGTALFGESNP